jgi:glycosyltransferase involved in cell wall biosynthesis
VRRVFLTLPDKKQPGMFFFAPTFYSDEGQSMKVVLVNASTSGGAYRAMQRLHCGLQDLGQDSVVFTQGKNLESGMIGFQRTQGNPVQEFYQRLQFKIMTDELRRYPQMRFGKPTYFESPVVLWGPDHRSQFPEADVYHLHDLKQFIDYRIFFNKLFPDKPWVWTLHDMTPFTGGCDYDYSCGRFQQDCGRCPALTSMREIDPSSKNLSLKMKVFEKLDPAKVRIVAPSRWLAGEAGKSKVFRRFNVSVIPYGLNLEDFAPRDKAAARELLGIPHDHFVFLTIGTNHDDYRKGCQFLEDTLQNLDVGRNFTLLSAGGGRPQFRDKAVKVRHVGGIQDDRLLSMVYSAADVFLLLSLADNLPNVAIESLACGTPVVAFNAGGISDIVEHANTGLLAKAGDVDQLKKHLNHLSKERHILRNMSAKCRETAMKKFSTHQQAESYLAIYRQLFQDGRAFPAAN